MTDSTFHAKETKPGGQNIPSKSPWELLARLAPWLLIGGLVLFHAVNNWIWLTQNVTWTGWDKARHLTQSLAYAQTLSPVTIRSLFELMVSDPIRPPLFPTSAAIVYALFSRSADVATMINIVYMAIALAATYGLGRKWGGQRLGLVSVAFLAFFPMFYAMSRYFYLEFALMALVALTIYLLVATDGFRRRGMSLFLGLSLGLGLLTKRTFAVFLVGPVIVIILSSGLLPMLWHRLKRRPRLHWKGGMIALIGGLTLAGLWYLPNRDMVQALILGDALFFLWWLLAALAIYFVTLPSAPLSNALAALFLAAGLGSTWYLTRIEFVQRVALFAYGINDPRGRALRLDQLDTYLYYVRKLGNEHLSFVLLFLFVATVALATVIYLRRQGSLKTALQRIKPEGWVVLTWLGGAYLFLTLSIYHETRAFTPALPAVALLFGAALFKLPWRRIRAGLLLLVLLLGLVQFVALTYEPVQRLLPPRTFDLPVWGRSSTLAQGVYIQLPDEGQTDSGYWIQPDLLRRMERQRQALGAESLNLGLLVNKSQINTGSFVYLILTEYPQLRVETLIDQFDDTSPYARLFGHDYLALKRDNNNANPSQEEVIATILDDPPLLFAQTFELETVYQLPDGQEVYLYRQRYHLPSDYPLEYVTDLAGALGDRTRRGDAILLTPPELIGPFFSHNTGPADVYLAPDSDQETATIAAQHRRIFLVLGDEAAGKVQATARDWLDRNTFRAGHEWAGSLQVIIYGTVEGTPAVTPAVEVGAVLGDQMELMGYDLPTSSWQPGDIVPLTLFWQRLVPVEAEYSIFVHLLDEDGSLLAQSDSAPVSGTRPTSGWRNGEIIVDRHGLLLPETLSPGSYELVVGMYLPSSGERPPVVGADGQPQGDSLTLERLIVAP